MPSQNLKQPKASGRNSKKPNGRIAQPGTAAERIAAAALELARGIGESASAASQLQRAMEQISTGAEEAAGAAQESLGLIKTMDEEFAASRDRAAASKQRAEQLSVGFAETNAQIESSVGAIELNAQRQLASVSAIGTLEKGATNIASTAREVSDISERTSLLAQKIRINEMRGGDALPQCNKQYERHRSR